MYKGEQKPHQQKAPEMLFHLFQMAERVWGGWAEPKLSKVFKKKQTISELFGLKWPMGFFTCGKV